MESANARLRADLGMLASEMRDKWRNYVAKQSAEAKSDILQDVERRLSQYRKNMTETQLSVQNLLDEHSLRASELETMVDETIKDIKSHLIKEWARDTAALLESEIATEVST